MKDLEPVSTLALVQVLGRVTFNGPLLALMNVLNVSSIHVSGKVR